ncbi:type II toxin-antitoxin system YafQ family toxin [Candidatus Uhrbacteria bacterium]|nr:type II toxin-antitoxin system YafQ family toxin [Candidatus Uhrbacteria bacterium]
MRSLFRRKQFKKDFKKISRNPRFDRSELEHLLTHLLSGEMLEAHYRNHLLSGEFANCYECHVQSDVLLIYSIDEECGVVYLQRIGSHSDLFA